MNKLYHLVGVNRRTNLREAIHVIESSLEKAVQAAETWADNVYQEREPTELGKDWNDA